MENVILLAYTYAVKCHTETNHLYDGKSYAIHLKMVYDFGVKYQHLLLEKQQEMALAGCFVHDVIEDTRQTYNDVKKICGEDIAEIAYALTNEKGRNRKERANAKYYEGIRENSIFMFVKICDRLANIKYSKDSGSRMFDAYKKEYENFNSELYAVQFQEMFNEMNLLLNN